MAGGPKFDISFAETIRQVMDLNARLAGMGETLDKLEASGRKQSLATKTGFQSIEKEVASLQAKYTQLVGSQQGVEKAAEQTRMALLRQMEDVVRANAKATGTVEAYTNSQSRLKRVLDDTAQKNTYIRWQERLASLNQEIAGQNQLQQKTLDQVSSAESRLNVQLKDRVKTEQNLLAYNDRLVNKGREIAQQLQQSTSFQAVYNDQMRAQAAATRRANTESTRWNSTLEEARRQLQSLNGGQQEQITRINSQISARRRLIREEELGLNQMSEQERRLARLQAEMRALQGDYGRQHASIQRAIRDQQEYNKILAMSTPQLLGFAGAQGDSRRAVNLSAQAAASWRAALTGLNASIGIYTSATIAAATATYALAASLRSGLEVGAEFTQTMSRAEAVMFSGAGMGDATQRMDALEARVRSLGQNTIFTSNQVAQGLVDLGMAGLSAGDAITALKPALDLASIGAIEMGESADIATNVMTTFKKDASDLVDIVDVMATAVTNSNTNIQQMANALTYVGPAAQAAGFSMRDTTAAIELLANAGIKSSKAGTGLRRFMVNILNPTAKGAAVLEKYGISVVNAEGHTRSLTDLMGQFHDALYNDVVTPGERTAAVVDLVGVRAASAVQRLMSSSAELDAYRQQLDDVAGAAERMRSKIEDNLSADWDQVVGAFQDAQLGVFENLEQGLRTGSAALAEYIQQLQQINTFESMGQGFTLDQINAGDGISDLDILIARIESLGDELLTLGKALIGFKAAQFLSNNLGGLSAAASKAGPRLNELAVRANTAAAAERTMATQTNLASTAMRVQTTVTTAATGALGGMAGALGAASAAVSRLAMAGRLLASAFGWVGLIYAIGSTIYEAFGKSNQEVLSEHSSRVKRLKTDYDNLNESMRQTERMRQRQAYGKNLEAAKNEISQAREQIEIFKSAQSSLDQGSPLWETYASKILLTNQRIDGLNREIEQTSKELEAMGHTQGDVEGLGRDFLITSARVADLNTEIEKLTQKTNWTSIGTLQTQRQINILVAERTALMFEQAQQQVKINEASKEQINWLQQTNDEVQALVTKLSDEASFDNLDNSEKLEETREKIAAVRGEIEKYQRLLDDGDPSNDPGADQYQRLLNSLLALKEEEFKYSQQRLEDTEKLKDSYQSLIDYRMTEEERLSSIRDRLAEINFEQMRYIALLATGQEQANPEKATRWNEELLRLYQERDGILSGQSKSQNSAAEKEKRRLDSLYSAFERLRGQYAPAINAQAEYNEGIKGMQELLDAGRIDDSEFASAKTQLEKNLEAAKFDADETAQALKRVKEEYTGFLDEYGAFMRDRAVISQMEDGPRKAIAEREWNNSRRDQLLEGQPDIPTLDNGVGGAFSEVDKMNQLAQQEQEWYQRRQQMQQDFLATNQQSYLDYLLNMAELDDKHAKNQERIERQSQIARVQGYAEMFGSMASLSATFAGDSSAITRSLLAFQQAANIASTVMAMATGEAKSFAELGPIAGAAQAASLAAMGAQLAATISSVAKPDSPSFSTSTYSGMYDKGGTIGKNEYGIVGEVGAEIVHGPATVIGRKKTSQMMGGNVTFAPKTTIVMPEGAGNGDNEALAQAVATIVDQRIGAAFERGMKSQGFLDKWKRS